MKLIVLFGGLFISLASACGLGLDGRTEVRDASQTIGTGDATLLVPTSNGSIEIEQVAEK